jgi:hypothetical protein
MTSDVERFATEPDEVVEDAVFLSRHGIAGPDEKERRHADPAIIARLLVFADELEGDAESLRDYALRLRGSLLSIYREYVFEPTGRRQMRGGHDG